MGSVRVFWKSNRTEPNRKNLEPKPVKAYKKLRNALKKNICRWDRFAFLRTEPILSLIYKIIFDFVALLQSSITPHIHLNDQISSNPAHMLDHFKIEWNWRSHLCWSSLEWRLKSFFLQLFLSIVLLSVCRANATRMIVWSMLDLSTTVCSLSIPLVRMEHLLRID